MESNRVSFRQQFPLEGKGTIIVNRKADKQFGIIIKPAKKTDDGYVAVQISRKSATFWGKLPGMRPSRLHWRTDKDSAYETTRKVAYWFSFNRDDRVLKYGKGYVMEETTLMTYLKFPKPQETDDEWSFLFDPQVSKIIKIVENFDPTTISEAGLTATAPINDVEKEVNFYPYPLIKDWPYVVKDSNNATMFDISSNDYILSASLPATCQELYNNVAPSNVDLDWPLIDNLNLSKAMAYSIATEGKILFNKIKEKKGEFTYIRVTLGYDRGSSPGIPYVLEIWPPKSKSPIHNHGNSYAVIKVLHGEIKIHIYNKTWPDSKHKSEQIKSFTVSKGDVTWLSPNWYQTHHLENESSDVYCATIQCYKYGDEDHLKWPYFDYLDGKNVENFKPDTDFEFRDLRTQLLEEYKKDHPQM